MEHEGALEGEVGIGSGGERGRDRERWRER